MYGRTLFKFNRQKQKRNKQTKERKTNLYPPVLFFLLLFFPICYHITACFFVLFSFLTNIWHVYKLQLFSPVSPASNFQKTLAGWSSRTEQQEKSCTHPSEIHYIWIFLATHITERKLFLHTTWIKLTLKSGPEKCQWNK